MPVEVIQDAGHMAQMDNPEAFNAVTLAFLHANT
jgi:pimeloyl-ACP methyl ester carboxylesterase